MSFRSLINKSGHSQCISSTSCQVDGRGMTKEDLSGINAISFSISFLPQLRNISKTAPYFHNGSKLTLEAVIDHYNDPNNSIDNYFPNKINEKFINNFGENLRSVKNTYRIFRIKKTRSPQMGNGLNLTKEEKANLLLFL